MIKNQNNNDKNNQGEILVIIFKAFWRAFKSRLLAFSVYLLYAINKFFVYPYMVKLVNSDDTTLDNKLLALAAAIISYLGDNDDNKEFDKIFHLNVSSGLNLNKINSLVSNKRVDLTKIIRDLDNEKQHESDRQFYSSRHTHNQVDRYSQDQTSNKPDPVQTTGSAKADVDVNMNDI